VVCLGTRPARREFDRVHDGYVCMYIYMVYMVWRSVEVFPPLPSPPPPISARLRGLLAAASIISAHYSSWLALACAGLAGGRVGVQRKHRDPEKHLDGQLPGSAPG